ncbi:MAG: hypothetical protein K0U40_04215 [Betaproteobacteria bacterium]|nr:hypothetical protein [Betaproteobacteria bacterium]
MHLWYVIDRNNHIPFIVLANLICAWLRSSSNRSNFKRGALVVAVPNDWPSTLPPNASFCKLSISVEEFPVSAPKSFHFIR